MYRQTSNISHTLVGNKIVDHSDVVGASPVGAAPTTSSFSTEHLASMYWAETTTGRAANHLSVGIWCTYIRDFTALTIISLSDLCSTCVIFLWIHWVIMDYIVFTSIIYFSTGGFSMGGALALHHGYRMGSGLAGVFALSGFLNESSVVYEVSLDYRQVSNVRRIKSQHLKDSCTVLQLSLPNPLKPYVKSRMKM